MSWARPADLHMLLSAWLRQCPVHSQALLQPLMALHPSELHLLTPPGSEFPVLTQAPHGRRYGKPHQPGPGLGPCGRQGGTES